MLTFLGFVREWEFRRTVGWNNGVTMFWITEADAEGRARPHRTGFIGCYHYAFELGARDEMVSGRPCTPRRLLRPEAKIAGTSAG